ncbi:MAG: hypothetical protein L6U99_12795 [Clostridium sp.]|nr:MAG: hypothetical protein L6U99_12795 [Clostridium sp.]
MLNLKKSLALLGTPNFFIAGVAARQIVLLVLLSSATTKLEFKGSSLR